MLPESSVRPPVPSVNVRPAARLAPPASHARPEVHVPHRRAVLLPLVCALLARSADAAAPAWTLAAELTPGHRVTVAAFLDAQRGITGGCDSGLYVGAVFTTGDGGKAWAPAKVADASSCRFGLEAHPSGAAWSSGNGGDIRASSDGGRSWTRVADFGGTMPSQPRLLSFADALRGAVATPGALGVTADGGKTWARPALPSGAGRIAGIAVTAEGAATVVRLLDEEGKLWASRDGGATWAAAPSPLRDPVFDSSTGPQAALRILPDGEGALVVNVDRDGMPAAEVWHTRDGGATWSAETVPGLPPSVVTLSADGRLLAAFDMHVIRLYRRAP
jgi:photosystem II stability/assembly factor-like uncharacterized protein